MYTYTLNVQFLFLLFGSFSKTNLILIFSKNVRMDIYFADQLVSSINRTFMTNFRRSKFSRKRIHYAVVQWCLNVINSVKSCLLQ